MACCLLGLGSNLGNRRQILDRAISRLDQHLQIRVVARSRCYQTPAIGGPTGQDVFLNQAARLETALDVDSLHRVLLETEDQLGRQRRQRWSARTIDLDLLLYDDMVCRSERLTVPHPRMVFRRFVLEPAAEIAGDMVHPAIGWTVDQLHRHMSTAPNYIAITGPPGAGKTSLATEVVHRLQTSHQLTVRLLQAGMSDRMLEAFYEDPTGHAWGTEIEFLRLRRTALSAVRATGAKEWWISDFWFDQSLAYAEAWLNEPQIADFRQLLEAAREDLILPKLLFVLQTETQTVLKTLQQSVVAHEAALPDRLVDRLRCSIEGLAEQSNRQPVLVLDASDKERAIEEVTAAVLAMHAVPQPV